MIHPRISKFSDEKLTTVLQHLVHLISDPLVILLSRQARRRRRQLPAVALSVPCPSAPKLKISLLAGNLSWRLVRSRLRRQPASAVTRDFHGNAAKKPADSGLLAFTVPSPCPRIRFPSGCFAKNLWASPALFPYFREKVRRRLVSLPLHGRVTCAETS